MIRLRSQVGGKQPLPFWLGDVFVGALQGDEDRIDLGEHLRIGKIQTPAPLGLIVVKEKANLLDRCFTAVGLAPRDIGEL